MVRIAMAMTRAMAISGQGLASSSLGHGSNGKDKADDGHNLTGNVNCDDNIRPMGARVEPPWAWVPGDNGKLDDGHNWRGIDNGDGKIRPGGRASIPPGHGFQW